MRRFIWAVSIAFGVLFVGCKTSHIGEKMKISGEQSESEKRVFSDCLKNSPDYTSYSAKTSFVITTSAGNLKSKATVRIIKDKILQISVQPFLGIEMFRVRLTNDSVWILDKMGKRYVAESIAAYKSKLPVDLSLSSIQALFLGRPFLPGKDRLDISDYRNFSWMKEKSDWSFSIKDLSRFSCLFELDELARLRETRALDISGQMQITWSYSKFTNQGEFWFPSEMEVRTSGIGNKNLTLKMENISPEWNKTFNVDFSVSSQYRKVPIRDLLNMFLK